MKCDLSKVWKQTIADKEWKDKQAADQRVREEAYIRLTAEVKQLTKDGWLFRCNEFVHPHNSDTILEAVFKSPRMLHYRWYDINTDFKIEEAKSLAHSHAPRLVPVVRELIENMLVDHFLEHPQATTPPLLGIEIHDHAGNHMACTVK